MINLAGKIDCDIYIKEELEMAGIDIIRTIKGDTPYTLIGRLGDSQFHRSWYYWSVKCHIPLEIAEKIYATEIGKKDIRVAGHCGCADPKEWSYVGFVDCYHIDSQVGLNLFADMIRPFFGLAITKGVNEK